MEEATFLTRFASKVVIVHRRDEFRASPIMVDRARDNEKVEFILNTEVDEVLGEGNGHVTGLKLRDTVTEAITEIEADGIFVAVGHDPNTALFLEWLDHDDAGYLVTEPRSTYTNVPGVFAAGDVQDHTYRQAVTAAGSGTMAALDAQRWLEEQRHGSKVAAAPAPA
jgi:thioredoxin reductase (NADPH)